MTGAAATRIGLGATTLHTALANFCTQPLLDSTPVSERLVYTQLHNACLIIIDKVGMLALEMIGFHLQ